MNEEVKKLAITGNCDCLFVSEDEVYYVIHSGENEGVTFTIIDFHADVKNGKIKYTYNPIIIENPYNCRVADIYSEIEVIVEAKIHIYIEREANL